MDHFFLQFLHIAEISKRVHNSRTLIPPVPCISQILPTFNLYSGKAKILRGGRGWQSPNHSPWPDMLAEIACRHQ